MPKQVFLRAADGRPLAKRFTLDNETGQIIKHSYPHVARFTSAEAEWSTIHSWYNAISRYSREGWCMLKGDLNRPLVNESRAGSTDSTTPTRSIAFDGDGIKGISCGPELLDLAVGTTKKIGYIEQLSSSMGIVSGNAYYAHLFAMLEREVPPDKLKLWMKWLNLTVPILHDQMTLTRSQNALRWPLDVSINQNDKLIYTADPICEEGVEDPLHGKRIQLHNARSGAFPVDAILATDPEKVKRLEQKRLHELREEAGLPRRNNRTKQLRGVPVASQPSLVNVTGVKESDEFVYLNLNGGDSWAYYFSRRYPDVLYNFKGEQNYALADVAPELHANYSAHAIQAQQEHTNELLKTAKTGKTYLVFQEPVRDMLFRGYYDHARNTAEFLPVRSVARAVDYLKENGQQIPSVIPEWHIVFDPSTSDRIDVDNRKINTYVPPVIERATGTYPTIEQLMAHMLAAEPGSEIYEHHLDWFAYKLQNPADLMQTAWLLHGVQGTGKGVWYNHVVRPLVGPSYCRMVRFEEFEEQFNSWAEECLVCFIDEVQATDVRHQSKAHAKLKNQITERTLIVRKMRENPRTVLNQMAFYLASNKPDPLEIEYNDRRFNVANYQADRASFIDHEFLAAIATELPAFYNAVMEREVCADKVKTAIDTVAKARIKALTENSIDQFSRALKTGLFSYFFDHLPAEAISTDPGVDVYENTRRLQYAALVQRMYRAYLEHPKNAEVRLSRDDVMRLAKYLIGKVPDTPHKFTSFVKHHDIHFERMRINGRVVQGYVMKIPHIEEELMAAWRSSWEDVEQLRLIKGSKGSDDD